MELDKRLRYKWSISVLEGTKRLGIAKCASHDPDKTQTNKPEWQPIFLKQFLKQRVFLKHIFQTKTLPRFPLVLSDRAGVVSQLRRRYDHHQHSIFRSHMLVHSEVKVKSSGYSRS